jgi:hypothetical protein
VRLSPTATGDVSSLFGISSKDLPEHKLPELLPGSRITIRQRVSGLVAVGPVEVALSVAAGRTSASAEVSTLVIPWLLILAIAVAAAGAWYWHRRRKQRRRGGPPAKKSGPQADKELIST